MEDLQKRLCEAVADVLLAFHRRKLLHGGDQLCEAMERLRRAYHALKEAEKIGLG